MVVEQRDLKNDDTTDAGFDLLLDGTTIGAKTGDVGISRILLGASAVDDGFVSAANPLPIKTATSPVNEAQTSVALAASSSATLDFAAFGAGTTGKLLKVTMASTVVGKYVISTRDGAVIVNAAIVIVSGMTTQEFRPVSKESVTLGYTGGDENFRVVVTNLDDNRAADFYVTAEWDEE